jgi:NAD(P)-dependent dehydrogenase (short-subunit alcohol dehydrogenase family)
MTSIADVSDRTIAELVSLSGRSAVVTGGAQGLGKGIARRLAEAGANVLIGDVNAEVAARAAADLDGRSSGSVLTANMDVSDSASVVAAAQLADAEFGGIDIWVNNAGMFPSVGLTEMSAEQWDKVFAVNARGVFLGSREAVRAMRAHGRGGVIVNVASLAGLGGIAAGLAAYVSSKHAVVGITRQLALECAPQRIRVLAVAPSFMVTEGNLALMQQAPQMAAQAVEAIPSMFTSKLGRVGVPDDIARAVLFCASDMSIFMTGTTLVVDAGESA